MEKNNQIMTMLANHNFAFFFTRGLSLSRWEKLGMLQREIKLYQKLAEVFHTVYLFTYGVSEAALYQKYFPENVVIVSRPSYIPVLLYSFLLPLLHRKKLRNVSFLKTNQMDGSWTAVIAKKISKAKLIVRCGYEWLFTLENLKKSYFKRKIAFWVERCAYRNADTIVMTAEPAVNFVHDRFGIPFEKMRIIPNYVDTELFKPADNVSKEKQVLFVGRFEKEKNILALVDAMQDIGAPLVLVGAGSMKEIIAHRAEERGVTVLFRGTIAHQALVSEMQKTAVFVLLSLYEGNPKVLLEAMACGAPCVGSNVSGIREIITDGDDGFLSGTDSQSIHRVLSLLVNNTALQATLGKNAREKVLATYSLERILQSELSVYNAL